MLRRYQIEIGAAQPSSWATQREVLRQRPGREAWPKPFKADFEGDVATPFGLGVVVGPSGSGRTISIEALFPGLDPPPFDSALPAIDQLPAGWSVAKRARALIAAGLNDASWWIKPAWQLPAGGRIAARLAVAMTRQGVAIADPWYPERFDLTAAILAARRLGSWCRRDEADPGHSVVLALTRRELLEDLRPHWVLDTLTWSFDDRRRSLQPGWAGLGFQVHAADRRARELLRPLLPALALPGPSYYVLDREDRLAAACSWRVELDHGRFWARLREVLVLPAYRCRGLAPAFLSRTAADLERRGFEPRIKARSLQLASSLSASPDWVRVRRVPSLHDLGVTIAGRDPGVFVHARGPGPVIPPPAPPGEPPWRALGSAATPRPWRSR